jgi:hypothetical protein
MRNPGDFLVDQPGPIPWQLPDGGRGSFEAGDLFLGKGTNPLEVAVATTPSRSNVSDVRQLWKRRKDNRPAPVLLIILYQGPHGLRAAMCGPTGDNPPVQDDRDPRQVERIATSALAEPNRNAAIRFLHEVLPESDSDLPGIRNAGMFATHQLKDGVPARPDWVAMTKTGQAALNDRGQDLIRSLGFIIDHLGATTSVLRLKDNGAKTAVAIFLDENETPEGAALRFGGTSPVSHALAQADAESLPYVVLTRGSQIRVYAARKHTGVGRKGRAETFIEANLALLPDQLAGYLTLLFGADALRPDGSFEQILEESQRFASGLGERLRDRVYNQVVPQLARVVAAHYKSTGSAVTEQELADLYELAMVILFRLLFVAYAEDKDLLPYRSNGLYKRNALKTLAADLAERANEGHSDFDPAATDMWEQIRSLSKAVEQGNLDWAVPAYNGGMFSSDPEISQVGARIADLSLTNAEIGPALLALLVDRTDEDVHGPVDFRSLSVREFGTIYEGLLESSLSVAPSDLTVAKDGTYVPAGKRDKVVVGEGDIYLHNRSGARKATGSYFTKPFAVEHLLEHALEPALDDHLKRLRELINEGEEHEAADAFFDFRCADIAMGSGHFLVAAVDHIEARLSSFLAVHQIPGVVNELERLKAAAFENLGPDLADAYEIEQASLLRRQVARRCIYGVDVNLIAVELARLGMWIHTFVPGLPLSFLDHNLVQGNSLTGIGTIDEALDTLVPETGGAGTPSLLRGQIEEWLGQAEDALRRLGRIGDASAREIKDARAAHTEAIQAVEPARRLFDLLLAVRLEQIPRFEDLSDGTVVGNPRLPDAESLAADLKSLHFPIAFPEVFLRTNPGFDCILGNPPWEKLHVEQHSWWSLRFPGLRGSTVATMNKEMQRLSASRPDLDAQYHQEVGEADLLRSILLAGPYPEMGRGHPDLFKAFAWRFWQLARQEGAIGVVLPRSALSSSGGAQWRTRILDNGAFVDVTMLTNTGHWAFDDMEPRYTIGLVSVRKGHRHRGRVQLRGPFNRLIAFQTGMRAKAVEFAADELQSWTSGAAFPLLPTQNSGDVFLKLRRHPRFDSPEHPWRVRAVQGDVNATTDKERMVLNPTDTTGLWPIYSGASFNLWNPDTGEYYAWARPKYITNWLQSKRLRQGRRRRSAFAELPSNWLRDPATLPSLNPRIAFRDVARATDSRTLIASLIPPNVICNHKAPYLLPIRGDARDTSFLLAVLSSVTLDWYARRMVEVSVTFELLNAFPIPNPDRQNPLRRRAEELAGQLGAVDHRYKGWAEAIGIPIGSLAGEQRHAAIAQLDALVAFLYGLDELDVRLIFETFHEGWDYTERLDEVLEHFRQLEGLR